MKIRIQPLAVGLTMAVLASAAFAQTADTPPAPGPSPGQPPPMRHGGEYDSHRWRHHQRHWHHGWRERGGGWDGPGAGLMGSFRELGLSDAQREQIRTIWSAERDAMQGQLRSARESMAALANPGDPGYAAAVQAAKTRAAERVQHMSDVQLKLYNVLTPQQKTQFTKILADKKARWDKWSAERGDHGPPGGGPGWRKGNGPEGRGNPPPPPAPAQ
jgi:Spy/CpxP family protein refolding chaperone